MKVNMKGYIRMGTIKDDLLSNQKTRIKNLKVKNYLYKYGNELHEELLDIGIIQRLKEVPQLGVIKVSKKLKMTRYDYIALQLYFHKLISENIRTKLEIGYGNGIRAEEFPGDINYLPSTETIPTIADLVQILTIAYNIGHFYNTFTASRAAVMLAEKNSDFNNMLINSSTNERFRASAEKLLDEQNYLRLHLLNSLLVLERCDQKKQSVVLAQELLYAYINEDEIDENSKLRFVFKVFRTVRNVSYISYDLQIAKTPFTIDLYDKEAILLLFRELLAKYNDQLPAKRLIFSISKMLDDTLYNENLNVICYYQISRKIVSRINKDNNLHSKEYYLDFWLNLKSPFNYPDYPQLRDYLDNDILKLTFDCEDKELSYSLVKRLETMNHLRVGYYDRHTSERTIIVSIKKSCENKTKVAFRLLQEIIKSLRKVGTLLESDGRYLLASKFFLFFLFDENPIEIKPTIDYGICAICTRGGNSRTSEIKKLLEKGIGEDYERHEVEFMRSYLLKDAIHDTSITIPASIKVYEKSLSGQDLAEFDGLIIHPMRKKGQVIFLEAKNTRGKRFFAKRCLAEKLDKLNITYDEDDIKIIDHNALLEFTI